MLIVSATGIVTIGALFVPLPVKEKQELFTLPTQRSATIVLAHRTESPHREVEESPTLPIAEEIPILQYDTSTPTLKEQITEQSEEPLAPQASGPAVAIEAIQSNLSEEEAPVAMKVYHEITGSIESPIFDLKRLSSLLVYPPAAKRQNKEGLVRLRLYISEYGIIERMVVEEDPGYGLAEATVKAFEQLKPQAAMQDGKPLAVTMVFPVRWTLK